MLQSFKFYLEIFVTTALIIIIKRIVKQLKSRINRASLKWRGFEFTVDKDIILYSTSDARMNISWVCLKAKLLFHDQSGLQEAL